MGYTKEPDNIDFVINGKPWTPNEKIEITEFIKLYKTKIKKKKPKKVKEKLEVN